MSPMNREASDFVMSNWNKMTGEHEWPPATPPGQLHEHHWKLHVGGGKFCDWNAIDFAGEIYRRVFGEGDLSQKDAKECHAKDKQANCPKASATFDAPQSTGTQATCPVSGESFTITEDTEHSEVDGKHVYFCCAGCKPMFDKEPEKYPGAEK